MERHRGCYLCPYWRGDQAPVTKPGGAEYNISANNKITVSKEELDTALGDMIDNSFFIIAGNLTKEPVNISGFLANDSLNLEINNEVSLNISIKRQAKPESGVLD